MTWQEILQQAQQRRTALEQGQDPWQVANKKRLKRAQEDIPLQAEAEQAGVNAGYHSRGLWWGSSGQTRDQQIVNQRAQRRQEDLTEAQEGFKKQETAKIGEANKLVAQTGEVGQLQGGWGTEGFQKQINDLVKQQRYGEAIGALSSFAYNATPGGVLTEYARAMLPKIAELQRRKSAGEWALTATERATGENPFETREAKRRTTSW